MKYAIVNNGGKQYKVSEGEEILLEGTLRQVDTLGQQGKQFELSEVMLVSDNGKVKVGNPFVKGAKIQASIVGEAKGEKVNVRKYKSKSRYRKAIGHRAQFTRVKVDKIVL